MAEISMKELRKRNEELAKNYTYNNNTSMGENNIPVTDSTVGRTVELPDYKVRGVGSGKPGYNRRTIGVRDTREEKSKKEFKMPKLKFSGKGKRTAMRGKIK